MALSSLLNIELSVAVFGAAELRLGCDLEQDLADSASGREAAGLD